MSNQQSNWFRILIAVLLILAQIILNNLFFLGPYVYISFIPLILMLLPIKQNDSVSLLLAFIIGLLIDLSTLDTLGLNAGAAVLACLFRKPFLRLCFNISDKTHTPTIGEAGIVSHLEFLFLLSLLYFCFYTAFDGFILHGFLPFLLRVAVSSVASVLLSLILDLTILNYK
ncbi:MAG: hypothetical protein J6Z27_02465 [Bacteroidales bacterium]|nr:hypothetical protein [Bacteroidales bacterium]